MTQNITFEKKIAVAATFLLSTYCLQAQTFSQNNINYEVTDATAKTVKVISSPDAKEDIVIPSSITHENIIYTVNSIGSAAFFSNSYITTVKLPETLESIESDAFAGCSAMTSINIPNSVKTIGNVAFHSCSSLGTVDIPTSLTNFGKNVFVECTSIRNFYIDSSTNGSNDYFTVVDGVLFNKDKTSLLVFPAGKTVNNYTIPNGVTTLETGAFYRASNLFSVTFPISLQTINEAAFANCIRITALDLPEGLVTIGDIAFTSMLNLVTVNIPSTVTSLSTSAFLYGQKLTSLNVAEGNPVYSSENGVLFNKDKTTLIQFPFAKRGAYEIPKTVTTVGQRAFFNCTALTSVTLPASLKTIEKYGFNGCIKLTSIINYSPEPQHVGTAGFEGVTASKVTLTVPKGSKLKYQELYPWQNFNIVESVALAVNDVAKTESTKKVYPNPTTGVFYVYSTTEQVGSVHNISGQLVKSLNLKKGENKVDVSNYPSGFYLMKVNNETVKVLKK